MDKPGDALNCGDFQHRDGLDSKEWLQSDREKDRHPSQMTESEHSVK